MNKTNKTMAKLKEEAHKIYRTVGNTFEMFSVKMRVQIISPCVDFQFFYEETGEVVSNSGGYLGIEVQLDEPRKYENGAITTRFNFNPIDLIVLRNKESERLARFNKWNNTLLSSVAGGISRKTGWVAAMNDVRQIIADMIKNANNADKTYYCALLVKLDKTLKQEIGEVPSEKHYPDFNPKNNLASMPVKYIGMFFNGSGDSCDMLQGPCACGATHHQEEWPDKIQKEVFGSVSQKPTICKRKPRKL